MDTFAGSDSLPTLETAQFVIRALALADVAAIFDIFSDPEVTRYWGHSTMRTIDQAEEFVQHTIVGFRNRNLLEWGVTERHGDRVIGTCAFAPWSREHRRAEIGYALRRDHWGRGIMTEVLPALIRFGFESLRLHRIEADVDPRNVASIKRLEQLGFLREGYLRQRYVVNEELQDAVLYGLLAPEYRGQR